MENLRGGEDAGREEGAHLKEGRKIDGRTNVREEKR